MIIVFQSGLFFFVHVGLLSSDELVTQSKKKMNKKVHRNMENIYRKSLHGTIFLMLFVHNC